MKDWTANEVILVLGAFSTFLTMALVPAIIKVIRELKELRTLTKNNHETNMTIENQKAYGKAMATQDPNAFELLDTTEKALNVAQDESNKLNASPKV